MKIATLGAIFCLIPVLVLALPAINYFVFEGANSFFWWDAQDAQSQAFKRTWMGY